MTMYCHGSITIIVRNLYIYIYTGVYKSDIYSNAISLQRILEMYGTMKNQTKTKKIGKCIAKFTKDSSLLA